MDGPGSGGGGIGLRQVGHILTPLPSRPAQICPSSFCGTDPSRPIAVAGAFLGVRWHMPLTPSYTTDTS